MTAKKYIMTFILGVFVSVSCAQDSTAFFTFTAQDIAANNITNLEEALQLTPFFYQLKSSDITLNTVGNLPANSIIVYKDNFPLMMDQNVGYNLKAIPMWDIERMELFTSTLSVGIKNSGYLIIHLRTFKGPHSPISASAQVVNNSASDVHTSFSLGLTNRVHTGQIAVNRSFTSALFALENERSTLIHPAERYDLNLKYSYKILRSLTLDVASNHSMLTLKKKGSILEGTSRVRDQTTQFSSHNINGRLSTALSRYHTLSLSGLISRMSNDITIWDKDLSTGKQNKYNDAAGIYSSGFDYGYMQLLLKSAGKKLNYNLGIELSNTIDNHFSTINAIATQYADYSLFGLFEYQFRNTFKLEGGVKTLNNNLTKPKAMPMAKLTLAPTNDVQLSACFQRSTSYPQFSQWFYPSNLTNTYQNNILLEPTDLSTLHLNLLIKKDMITINSGLLYNRNNKLPRNELSTKWQNESETSGSATYISMKYKGDFWMLQPTAVIHGTNEVKDTTGLNFFQPELTILGNLTVPKTGLTCYTLVRLIGRKTSSELKNSTILLKEYDAMNNVNAGLNYAFPSQVLQLGFGVINVLNSTLVNRTNYTLTKTDIIEGNSFDFINSRPRSFYFKLTYTLK